MLQRDLTERHATAAGHQQRRHADHGQYGGKGREPARPDVAVYRRGIECQQQATVAAWVEQGPDLERDGVVRWRCVDLQRRIAQEFAVSLHERTIGKLLRKLSFRRLSVRPQHPQSKPEVQALFKAGLLIS